MERLYGRVVQRRWDLRWIHLFWKLIDVNINELRSEITIEEFYKALKNLRDK